MKTITVFTRTTCGPCHALKTWLGRKGVDFKEVNIDESPEARAEAFALTGYSIVPVTVIADDDKKHVVAGFNIANIASLLAPQS